MSTSGTLSKKTFGCFVCQNQGFNERVYLAGKDSNGRTMYLEPDGVTTHRHKFKERTINNTPTTLTTTADTIISLLKNIDQKLDVLVKERDREQPT